MKPALVFGFLTGIAVALFSGCDRIWSDCYWRAERYMLVAVDAKSQMSLSFDLKNGGSLDLVGATVFSIGSDAKFIVVKQHPGTGPGATAFDRAITNYFVVERTESSVFADRKKGVRGPMSKEEFEKLAARESLPSFSKTFDDLK